MAAVCCVSCYSKPWLVHLSLAGQTRKKNWNTANFKGINKSIERVSSQFVPCWNTEYTVWCIDTVSPIDSFYHDSLGLCYYAKVCSTHSQWILLCKCGVSMNIRLRCRKPETFIYLHRELKAMSKSSTTFNNLYRVWLQINTFLNSFSIFLLFSFLILLYYMLSTWYFRVDDLRNVQLWTTKKYSLSIRVSV